MAPFLLMTNISSSKEIPSREQSKRSWEDEFPFPLICCLFSVVLLVNSGVARPWLPIYFTNQKKIRDIFFAVIFFPSLSWLPIFGWKHPDILGWKIATGQSFWRPTRRRSPENVVKGILPKNRGLNSGSVIIVICRDKWWLYRILPLVIWIQ